MVHARRLPGRFPDERLRSGGSSGGVVGGEAQLRSGMEAARDTAEGRGGGLGVG